MEKHLAERGWRHRSNRIIRYSGTRRLFNWNDEGTDEHCCYNIILLFANSPLSRSHSISRAVSSRTGYRNQLHYCRADYLGIGR